jgi:hypothetical protein
MCCADLLGNSMCPTNWLRCGFFLVAHPSFVEKLANSMAFRCFDGALLQLAYSTASHIKERSPRPKKLMPQREIGNTRKA